MKNRNVWIGFKFLLVAGIIFHLYRTGKLEPGKLSMAVQNIPLFIAAILLFFFGTVAMAQRWSILLHAQNFSLNLVNAVKLILIGLFFSVVLPGGSLGGDFVKAYYLTKGERQKEMLVTSIVFDRMLGLYTLVFIAASAAVISYLYTLAGNENALWAHHYLKALGIIVIAWFFIFTFTGLLFMNRSLRKSRSVEIILRKIPFRKTINKVYDSVLLYGHKPGLMFRAFFLSIICHFLTYAGFFCIAMLLKITELDAVDYLFALPIGTLINALPLFPGGLGLGEAGFNTIFQLFGSHEGAELAVIYHVIFFASALGLGGIVYLFSDISRKSIKQHAAINTNPTSQCAENTEK